MLNPIVNAIINYLAVFVTDGDYANDWLTHMPGDIANLLESTCHLISLIINPLI